MKRAFDGAQAEVMIRQLADTKGHDSDVRIEEQRNLMELIPYGYIEHHI